MLNCWTQTKRGNIRGGLLYSLFQASLPLWAGASAWILWEAMVGLVYLPVNEHDWLHSSFYIRFIISFYGLCPSQDRKVCWCACLPEGHPNRFRYHVYMIQYDTSKQLMGQLRVAHQPSLQAFQGWPICDLSGHWVAWTDSTTTGMSSSAMMFCRRGLDESILGSWRASHLGAPNVEPYIHCLVVDLPWKI